MSIKYFVLFKEVFAITIGEKVKQLRRDANLTGEEIAKKVGTTSGMIFRIETNAKLPSLLLISAIASVLEVNLSEMFKGVNVP